MEIKIIQRDKKSLLQKILFVLISVAVVIFILALLFESIQVSAKKALTMLFISPMMSSNNVI